IVVVSSTLHERGNINFDDLNIRKEIEQAKKKGGSSRHNPGYSNSKLMNAYFARALAYSIKWYHYIFMAPILIAFMKTAKQGSETVVFCATDHSIEGKTGKFYRDCAEYNSKYNFDKDVETKLWNVSEELVKARKPL
ncbi:hypothetical protein SFRURICE_004805, partial [Spodoptera frugiperda]